MQESRQKTRPRAVFNSGCSPEHSQICHPVYNHDGPVNGFLRTRMRQRGNRGGCCLFSLIRGFCFWCCGCICLRPSHSCLPAITGGCRTSVPLPIYSVLATMISRANSPPGRLALWPDPRRGGALTQSVGLADPRMTRATPHTNQFCMRLLRLQHPEHAHRQLACHHHFGHCAMFLAGQTTVLSA